MKKILIAVLLMIAIIFNSMEGMAQTTKSRAGKNALIGAAAGAATGALVSKKKGKGALIGGAIGAVGGYAWGKHRDKKRGRKVVYKH